MASGFKHLEIPLEEIISATNNFDDSNVIGVGRFGKVYKGELSHSGGLTTVALRRLDRKYGEGVPEFFKEIRMLSQYRHENIISLLGFCNENGERILVYEYAKHGSLDRQLSRPDLSWNQRLRICIGAARGLGFLHDPNGTQQRVLHRDIKSANILLDQNLNAKVADFGLSKIGLANQQYSFLITSTLGTLGYCDPVYMKTGLLTKESDVYSFGVVLFEVLCGRLCVENSSGQLQNFVPFWKKSYKENKLEEIISKDILGQISPECLESFSRVASQCLHKSREKRPTMALILKELEIAFELQIAHTSPKVIMATLEGASSSLPSTDDLKYDLYLSFLRTETRFTFIDHLYKALEDANLVTYSDDKNIQTGVDVAAELYTEIKASRGSVIVMSKNYATSIWCLNELALILERHREFDHIVIPIFYHVKHNDVMEDFKKNMAAEKETVMWKNSLTEVADLKGHHYVHDRPETENIQEIVVDIYHRLSATRCRSLPDLIGVTDQVDFICSWLKDESSHTGDILTILGMGGIGKTSLAQYVYEVRRHEFDRRSFINNISSTIRSEQSDKLLSMQRQLFYQISNASSVQVNNVFDYTAKIKKELQGKKVLVVLDDVDSLDHLNVLLGDEGFHQGSKIIITTRDASLTNRYLLFNPLVQANHTTLTLNGLDETSSLQLLCSYAFKRSGPTEDYEQVCKKIVAYCEGHPLALKVIGSFLHGRGVAEWEVYIETLKHKPDSSIQKALQVTFESLPYRNDKELFLHIACFFVEMDRDVTETILDACDIITVHGISTLIESFLLTIGPTNKLMMHPLLQEMGRDVVRQESPENLGNRSRLWYHKETLEVLNAKKGSTNVLGLTLDMKEEKEELHEIETDAFSSMENLMLLQLNYVKLKGSYDNFPDGLRWLCMHGFPSKSIPSDLPMENLVALDLSYSKINSFDMALNDESMLGSLKILNLSFSEQLHTVGGFVKLRALERLIVSNCTGLIKFSGSIEHCIDLATIDLSHCSQLEALPTNLGKLKKLKTLLLDGCNLVDTKPK